MADCVLFSTDAIVFDVPVMGAEGRPSNRTTRLTIHAKNVLDVQVHFSRSLSAIFIRVSPWVSRQVSKALGLVKKDSAPYWDTISNEECERRLILLLSQIIETEKVAIKKAFVNCSIYKEISSAKANEILIKASIKCHLPLHPSGSPAE